MLTRRWKGTGSPVTTKQNALEFVTITSPNEIKDPVKQKAIRQHARRRGDDPSRKSFRIVFDLPAAEDHNHAGVERDIAGRQGAGSYGRDFVGRENSMRRELNAVVPSFHFLRPISAGRGLIFTSPLSPEMGSRVVQLVDFMRQGGDKKFCPLMDFWWNIAQLDSTAFFITLAYASRLINQSHPIEPKESSEAIKLYTKSIQCLQRRLQTPVEGLSDGVIISILEFAYYDFLVQDLVRWLVHMSGLAEVIRRRGGIGTLSSSEIILLLNFWIDVSGSFIFDIAPFFPPPHHLLSQVTKKVSLSPILQKWNATFPELSDITTFLCHAANLSIYIDEHAISGEIWTDDLFVSRTFNGVVHQLLSFPRHTEALEKGIISPQQIMREAMRRACIILFALLRDKFSVHPSGISQHRNSVKELLVKHPVDWRAFLELRLWVLLNAALAPEDDETSWYIGEITDTMVQMGISNWDDGVEVARSILWMGQTFKIRNDRLRQLFELSTVY